MKILIVEDEYYARQALIHQVEEYDKNHIFEILQASNGEEGEKIFLECSPDLIMTDIRMPKMDGLDLLAHIREQHHQTQVIILSAYSDFDYARKAITYGASEYLLKPVEDHMLAETLDHFLQQKHNEKKEALLTGRDMATRYIYNCVRKKGYKNYVEETTFAKIFPAFQTAALYFNDNLPEQATLLSELENMYGSAFWTHCRIVDPAADLWLMMIQPDFSEKDTVFVWRKVKRLLDEMGFPVKIGISERFTKTTDIYTSYSQAKNVLKYKIYGTETFFRAEILKSQNFQEYYVTKAKENLLRTSLQEHNKRKVMGVIDEIFSEISRIGLIKWECLDLFYNQLMLIFQEASQLGNIAYDSENRSTDVILKYNSLDELKKFFSQTAEWFCQTENAYTLGNKHKIVDIMTEYADEHYSMDVTVKKLAETVLYMNQDYISHLFVEKKGISFSSYLRKVRIDHAKELLENCEYSVTEIATRTGYNDASQFIRSFKQETGITPKKYRSTLKDAEV